MSGTIDYYDKNVNEFFETTVNADISEQYNFFEKYLYKGAALLDCGCGSGRDTKYFLEKGYDVTAIDGSKELCMKASKLTGIDIKHMLFQDINFDKRFDGIWACASLLHLSKEDLIEVINKLKVAMTSRGVLYISFKYGEFCGIRNGRYFLDLTEGVLNKIIGIVGGLKVKETYISVDVRPGRENEKWLNAIITKEF
jgi:methyltransferase domain